MNKCFCQCAREHTWPEGSTAICRCGRVLEPMTDAEFDEALDNHYNVLDRMARAMTDLEPTIRFFRD